MRWIAGCSLAWKSHRPNCPVRAGYGNWRRFLREFRYTMMMAYQYSVKHNRKRKGMLAGRGMGPAFL